MAELPGISRQDDEHRLGDVLCIVVIGHHPPRNCMDHRAVAFDQSCKSGLGGSVSLFREFREQLGVRFFFQVMHFANLHIAGWVDVSKKSRFDGIRNRDC